MFVRALRPANDAHDHHSMLCIPDEEYNPPITRSNTMQILIQLLNAMRPRLFPQRAKDGIQAGKHLMRHAVEFPLRARKEDDLVGHDAYAPDARRLLRYEA